MPPTLPLTFGPYRYEPTALTLRDTGLDHSARVVVTLTLPGDGSVLNHWYLVDGSASPFDALRAAMARHELRFGVSAADVGFEAPIPECLACEDGVVHDYETSYACSCALGAALDESRAA